VLLRQDMDESRMVMRIVSFEGRPFAYAQDYAARRAYEKAGFRGDTVVESGEGPAILMIFDG
jgi:hypothetical protein